MTLNFFGKTFQWTFLLIILAELLSLTIYLLPPLNQAVFLIIILLTLILSLMKLEYGFYLLLAELFIGGQGHLFDLNINGLTISIRMGLFLVILGAWIVKSQNYISRLKAKSYHRQGGIPPSIKNMWRDKLTAKSLIYFLLYTAILFGIVNGLTNNNLTNVFFDANAWLYFALIPVFLTVIKDQKILENIFQILVAATSYLSLKTIVVLFLFSRNFAGVGSWFYHWLRASGVGEVTYISGTLFRVFFQSHVYVLISLLIVLFFLINQFKIKGGQKFTPHFIYIYLASLAIFISQSRSYWVGAFVALIFLIVILIWLAKIKIKKIALITAIIAFSLISQFYLIELITGNYAGNLVAQRFKNLPQEAAGISRLNQLKPLSEAIFQKLIFGYGFGKTLTYESRDPRILQTHPDGIYTTYAFEWGYLDIALKLGVVGLGIYLALIGYLFYLGLKNYKLQITNYKQISNLKFQIPKTKSLNDALQTTSYQLQAGLLIGLITLIVTNIFSPYLNHPLGIGYVMLLTAIFNLKD